MTKNVYDVYFLQNIDEIIVISENNEKYDFDVKQFSLENFKKHLTKLDKQTIFEYAVNGYNIVGHSILKELVNELKKRPGEITFKNTKINIKDLKINIRTGSGGLIVNEKLKKFLILLYNIDETYFGLVKGGIEEGETPKLTAYREIMEETGLKVKKFFDNIELYSMHNTLKVSYDGTRSKNIIIKAYVVWHLAVVDNDNIKLSNEHKGYKWVNLEEAKKTLTYESDFAKLEFATLFFKLLGYL